MQIKYIYHSCFLIETDEIDIIIDFYKDFPTNNKKGMLDDIFYHSDKPLYVLSSHSHYDHFNPEILMLKDYRQNIIYILSNDIYTSLIDNISKNNSITSLDIDKCIPIWLNKGDSYSDKNIMIKAFGSTDLGISFLITIDNKTIFHAGDLNNWHWKDETPEEEWKEDEKKFLSELEDIWKEFHDIDIVMFPIDYRLGTDYMRGAIQFIDKINVHNFFPMHFDENYISANKFNYYCNLKGISFFDIKSKGQLFIL